jgi:molecular chaperone IbpA
VVQGEVKDKSAGTCLHRGIAERAFQRVFELADYITVAGATMSDGLLVIDLKRELPEALTPGSAHPIRTVG